jgi:3-oxoacyl-[acyl-carrier-protein] synthase II
MPHPRVVITGFGTANPAGHSIQETWAAVCSSRPAPVAAGATDARKFPRVEKIDFAGLPVRKRDINRMNRADTLGVVAAARAMLDAGWAGAEEPGKFGGLFLGTTKDTASYGEFLQLLAPVARRGFAGGAVEMVEIATRYLTPFLLLDCMPNLALHYISEIFKLRGDNCCFLQTGAAGSFAILAAYNAICTGRTTMALAGGFDSSLDRLSLARLSSLGLLTADTERGRCRPFDRDRDGFLPGEGAAVLLLEARETAIKRGATIQGEILGGGSACETACDPRRRGGYAVTAAITVALGAAGISPADIGVLVAAGEGTPAGDRAEIRGISGALGGSAEDVPVTAFKGSLGHLMAASGPLESMLAIQALGERAVPPICGCEETEETWGLRLVRETVVPRTPIAITLGSGTGGQVCALAFRKGD